MEDPVSVTIIDVTLENVAKFSPMILQAVDTADFVAIDQELSGLGNTVGRGRLEMGSYYTRLRESAETRRVISIGLSCFKSSKDFTKPHKDSCDPLVFTCITFHILLMPDGEFEMDGSAKRFLVAHGFDLNRWTDSAILYSPHGIHNDFMSSLVEKLLTSRAAIVFHNGMTDLAFFYHSFWNLLPKGNEVFAADVADMFGERLFDTKVICNKVLGWRMHSLEYCYKKAQRITERCRLDGKPAVLLRGSDVPLGSSDTMGSSVPSNTRVPSDAMSIPIAVQRKVFAVPPKIGVEVCELLYHFGYCNAFKTGACKHSVEEHQMDRVLDVEEQKKTVEVAADTSRPGTAESTQSQTLATEHSGTGSLQETIAKDRQESITFRDALFRPPASDRSQPIPAESSVPEDGISNDQPQPPSSGASSTKSPGQTTHPQRLGATHFTIDNGKTYNVEFGLHSAGFDAFMTGYVYAVCLAQLGRVEKEGRVVFAKCEDFVGRVHVTGKSECYSFIKSVHVKASAKHAQKMARIRMPPGAKEESMSR